jgi:hypothetical protein
VYDERVREYGSYDSYKEATKKGMNASEFKAYEAQIVLCRKDWSQCQDNAQLVNNWEGISKVKVECKYEAESRAKYKTEWPWLIFGKFYTGKSFITSGIVRIVEDEASFQNGFGAMARVNIECSYDLKTQTVIDVTITER